MLSPGEKPGCEPEKIFSVDCELVDGDSDIADGVSVLLTPGHTVGMQCVVVNTAEGKYIIGGDQIPLFSNWETAVINGNGDDFAAMEVSMKKLRTTFGDVTVLPGHDELVFDRYKYRTY